MLFSGITHVTGPKLAVKKYLHAQQDADVSCVPVRLGNEGVVLDGADADEFLQDEYNLAVPKELKGKSIDEAWALHDEKPWKYAYFLSKVDAIDWEPSRLIEAVFDYFDEFREQGRDIEGHPIREITV